MFNKNIATIYVQDLFILREHCYLTATFYVFLKNPPFVYR